MANEFIVKNGFKSQGDSEVTGSFTATSGMSGSFSGSFQGDGSSLSNVSLPAGVVSGSAQISYTGITDVPSGIVSSSAQIASDISGSFGAASASFSTRVTTNETDISTLTAATASYILASQTSSMSVATASYVEQAVSSSFASTASYAVTASHALNTAPFPFSGDAVITGSLVVSGSSSQINTTTGILYDSSANPSVSYGQRGLFSSNGTSLSVQYDTRRLYATDGTTIVFDWSTGDINDTNGILAVDLGERTLNDRNGNEIASWNNTAVSYFSASLIGTASYADNATSASYAANAGGVPAINITANGTTLTEVTSDSDLPDTLAANTTYLIRGNVHTGRTLNVTNAGSSIIGVGRNQSNLSYTGSNELFNVHDASFSIRSLTMKSSGSIMTAKNVSPGAAYNDGRTKVLDIKDCQVKNTNNVMEVHGFELVDLNNVLFWYITGSQGLSFQSVRHLEISSCEFYNWYDETDTGSFAPAGTKMVEIRPNTGSVNTPVVNINSSIFHPEQSQIGLYIDSGSETLFGTVASNTFIDVNGGTLLAGSNYDSGSMLKYDIGINQGLEDSKAYLYGYQSGTDAQSATTTYTQITIANFQTDIETRMSASTSGITYIGTKPIDVMFQVSAGITDIASNNEQFDIALYKNTILIPGSERRIELDSNEEGAVTCFALTNIVQDDLLTVYQKSPTNDGFTLQNFAIMIKE
jgi:hypothetical protein